MSLEINNEDDMLALGESIGKLLHGGEVIELIGDVGSGKTTLTRGIAFGMGVAEYVQSPSFTISRLYEARDGLRLAHYDFYRLDDAGVMMNELEEAADDSKVVVVIEWGGVVKDVLPSDRLSVTITPLSEGSRKISCKSGGVVSNKLKEQLKI
jgi:tRNA threonylcarbamoyladenosine biosynthesis protein TsaE